MKLNQIQMPIIADGATAENAFDANNIDVNTTGTLPQDIPKYKKNGALQIDPAWARTTTASTSRTSLT